MGFCETNWSELKINVTLSDNWSVIIGEPTLFFGTTDNSIEMAWDEVLCSSCGECEINYEIVLHHVEQDSITPIVITSNLSHEFKLPRSGHFIFKIRAINIKLDSSDLNYASDWTFSTDPTTSKVNDEMNGWWFYGHIAKPGVINFFKSLNPFN